MLYKKFLKTVKICPFCELSFNKIIKTMDRAFLTYSLAPYCKHHLLVVPKRHIEDFADLNNDEKKDIDSLLREGARALKLLGHKGYSILLRNGERTGRSIKHLHYHIIPSSVVGSLNVSNVNRKTMTEKEVNNLMKKFKNIKII